MELLEKLEELESKKTPIRVGLVGCGQMGSGLMHVTNKMPGLATHIIADIDVDRPLKELKSMGYSETLIRVTNNVNEAEEAIRNNKYVVTEDALMLTKLENIDILIEATGNTEIGAQVAWNAIWNKKNIVMLNVETDVTVGLYLSRMAKKTGCVYTVSAGDEPGVCKGLYDFSRCMGFEVVCLGKGKNNIIDYDANPESCREEAEKKNMNPKMLASFKDGTKTMVEMAAVSNATGLVPDVPGMHGPKVDIDCLKKVFIPKKDGGIFNKKGCVDFSTGPVAPGVFVIVTTDDEQIQAEMKFLLMGEGPYYMFLRPFHLTSIETPLSAAEAVLYGETTVVAKDMVSEVIAIAKRDLKPGEKIGGIGSADFFNRIYISADARKFKGIPMGIAPNGKPIKEIKKGDLLTEENFLPDSSTFVYQLWKMQEKMLGNV